MIDPQQITGLVLAGGRGSRMGGVDKGLQNYRGLPLALHALQRLKPQVGPLFINANRNLTTYEAMDASAVWPDSLPDYPGPLAGFLAGLTHCDTPYLATVPCDSPFFPHDLVHRLGLALVREGADLAMAATAQGEVDLARDQAQRLQVHPVFCLMKAALQDSLLEFTEGGLRKVEHWASRHHHVIVPFDDTLAFANANTQEQLQALQRAFDPHVSPGTRPSGL